MLFRQIFDPSLAQYAYLIGCQATGEAVLVDPERDVDRYLAAAREAELELTAVAETHIHADFLSGARELASRTGARVYLSGEGGEEWSYRWGAGAGGGPSAEDFEVTLLRHGDAFHVGKIEVRALHTPGHTPEHLSFLVVDHGGGADEPMGLISGDFAFVGDLGRPDLLEQAAGYAGVQEEAARQLYRSLPVLLGLEDYVQLWPGHGAGSACGKALGAVPTSTVGYERRHNPTLGAAAAGEDAFVEEILSGQPEPPLYFDRMKRSNRDGPPILGGLPEPIELGVDDLARLAGGEEVVFLDTRTDPSAFMARHVPGSLYSPLKGSFGTRVGSVVVDPERPLVLVVEGSRVERAVRELIRIGYDRIDGFVTPATLEAYFDGGGPSASMEEVGFDELDRLRHDEDTVVLDVRYASEYGEGHVPGAVNASYTRLPQLYDERVPAEGTLVIHCSSGIRSAVAAAWLRTRGREVVYVGEPWSVWAASHPAAEGAPSSVGAADA